jgi:hypothetical protein
MFGFFDTNERRLKKALEAFGEEIRSDPLAERSLRSSKQLHLARRAGVLRASGNAKLVSKEVMESLTEDMDRWISGKDAYDLHYIVETLRLCGLFGGAGYLMSKENSEKSKQFPIDQVWIHLDQGLVGHQIGDDVRTQICCFNEALACRPPAGSKCSWREEARLQAAFCGFVAASASRLDAEAQQFLGILQELSPERDWCSGETLEEFGKGFVGFLSNGESSPPGVGQKASPAAQEEHTFHYCIYNQPRRAGQPDTEDDRLARSLITAEVSVKNGADGIARFTCKRNQGHDPLDVVEIDAAMFWYLAFEDGRVSREQVLNWLIDFDRVVGTKTLDRDPQYLSRDGDIVFYGALCLSSMLAFTAFLDSVESKFSDAAERFRIQLEEQGSRNRRAWMVPKAAQLRDLMIRGEIDHEFSRLLCESVGMVTDGTA